ncbi:phage protein Gp36 family protein [Ascidiaceihabitans sp.]|uniref:phage protein Gp36 family protein n=1 Tax=Ascidiaceihabitans sp. TaxID=1872644 RepID=UPI0032980610
MHVRCLTNAKAYDPCRYLATRYRLPLNPMSDLIQPLAEKLVIYDLHTYTPDQKITDEHKNAIATLKLIADGTLRLPSGGIEPQGTGGTGAQSTDRDREMTPDKLSGFI